MHSPPTSGYRVANLNPDPIDPVIELNKKNARIYISMCVSTLLIYKYTHTWIYKYGYFFYFDTFGTP